MSSDNTYVLSSASHDEWRILIFPCAQVDHYNFANDTTFKQKYLVNDDHWDKDNGPIFFYTGNEGRIEAFAENTVYILFLLVFFVVGAALVTNYLVKVFKSFGF